MLLSFTIIVKTSSCQTQDEAYIRKRQLHLSMVLRDGKWHLSALPRRMERLLGMLKGLNYA